MPIVIDDDSDASSLVSNANNEDVGNLLLGDEERRTFPQPNIIENQPIVIDDDSDASSLVFNANNEDVGNLLLGEEERRTFPQPNIIENQPILIDDDSDASSLDRNANPLPRQRREEITPDPPTSSTTQALKKQKRNKRRKDMRRRAIVRRQDASNSGNIELGQQLSTAENRLQNMQNNGQQIKKYFVMNITIRTGFERVIHDIIFQPETIPKGKALVKANHVRNVEERRTNGESFLIQAQVIRQTSVTSPPYCTKLNINAVRKVIGVSCNCVYNKSGRCKHIAALIYYINCEDSLTKTDFEQQWCNKFSFLFCLSCSYLYRDSLT
ncbi:uncharacterized protein [Venturia canescens]|uniref:uncharacterized protein isoform X2 n=1 Tax=Venturia canescens TaxID=32260 RepID=UPI001C9D0F7E|nr:uncharacterized protein LOC122407180 isoform X2 [Venturia canescens]